MTIPARISLITLGVHDLARSTAFYQALGWPLSPASQAEVSFFHTGGALLALFGTADLAADAHLPLPAPNGFRGVALAINLASEAEVAAAFAKAAAVGAGILKAPEKVFWGGYSGYFADPDGHVWEVAYNPFWPLDDNGLPQLP